MGRVVVESRLASCGRGWRHGLLLSLLFFLSLLFTIISCVAVGSVAVLMAACRCFCFRLCLLTGVEGLCPWCHVFMSFFFSVFKHHIVNDSCTYFQVLHRLVFREIEVEIWLGGVCVYVEMTRV